MSALKTTVKRAINRLGFRIHRVPRESSDSYEEILPRATYAPWNADAEFQTTYDKIRNHTLVDKYRCFELWQMASQVAKLSEGAILEVGVWRGGTGALMARQAANCGVTDPVYLCDTFCGVVKATDNDETYRGGEHSDTSVELVQKLMADVGVSANTKILQGIFPDDTANSIANQKFRLCHIDVDVYQSAKEVNEWVWERLVPGGIVVYDDYGFEACDGITKCVEEQRDRDDRVVFHNLNGHAVVVKLGLDETEPSPAAADNTSCEADAFMDEEDSEAVAERLRQLGYL